MNLNYYSILLILFISLTSFGQSYSNTEIYSWYDTQTGIQNSKLLRGVEYIEEHRMINENHKFLESNEFQKGVLVYDGQLFNEVTLKFNIYDDILLIYLQYEQRNLFFELFSDKVNNFQLHGHEFSYIKTDNDSSILGFYEIISEEGDFKIFKKHIKDRTERRDKRLAYFEFYAAKPAYVFEYNGEFYDLNKRRDLFSRFPDRKKEIKDFYRDFKKQSRNNPDEFMERLAEKMSILLSNTQNDIDE
ncbi:hypothetical protein LB452_11240 [Psychroflexus sp. CAK8W]|uniref:YARHG domain-containing protein n=1 Tax=Psychroflexus longus TaxID=2873596 RepID=A0ABS7XKJ8_9FLAO|nr:hypothetical protein [Psychroflexus longus]MBZ9779495.1 hypothetical protein [Psychroflexus longus]